MPKVVIKRDGGAEGRVVKCTEFSFRIALALRKANFVSRNIGS